MSYMQSSEGGFQVIYPPWPVVPVLRSCHNHVRTWLVRYLHFNSPQVTKMHVANEVHGPVVMPPLWQMAFTSSVSCCRPRSDTNVVIRRVLPELMRHGQAHGLTQSQTHIQCIHVPDLPTRYHPNCH